MKDKDIPSWLPKRNGSTPLLTAYELGFWKCPKCKHDFQNKEQIAQCKPNFSEWEHFIWCSYCKEQFPAMLWMTDIKAQEKKFLQHIKELYPEKEKSPPDLKGYTRFPKASGGGVWIKNEGERKDIKQICGHELFRRGIIGGEGPLRTYCLDCKGKAKQSAQEMNYYKGENKYVFAYDPTIRRRVVHLIVKRHAVSMVSGHAFPLPKHFKMPKRK